MPIFWKNKDKEYAIIGLGRFGGNLARRLVTLGHTVLGIDIDPHVVKEIADEITEAVILDATDLSASTRLYSKLCRLIQRPDYRWVSRRD